MWLSVHPSALTDDVSASAPPDGDLRGQSPARGGRVAASTRELARSVRSARTGVCTFVKRGGDPLLKCTCSKPSGCFHGRMLHTEAQHMCMALDIVPALIASL